MSRLDELEDKYRVLDQDLDEHEMDLIFRAVRQLGKGRHYKNGYFNNDAWTPYDPDVLELLEEA